MNKSRINSVIFYYSQIVTENTKRVAENIAIGLRRNNNKCKLVRLTKFDQDIELLQSFAFDHYDLIGFGVPVYYFHPPYHIKFELKKLPSLKGRKGFLFCTSGGNPGSTLQQIKMVLKAKDLHIIDGCDKWKGLDVHQMYANQPNSNGGVGWLPSSFGHPTTEELGEARKFGEKLIDKMNSSKRIAEKKFWARDNPSAKMWSWEGIQEWFPKFHLNKQKCTKCGICAKICPWDAIKLTPYPEWIKKCDRCYICELKCPENAIECDFTDQIEYLENLMRSKKKG
ncbi:MAG: hypothetical protein GF317_13015 [Candidatus Lokiarchaeota archaeon]|nr:hypothetical protein [Candidatus Lokiarchaeota archaeon]MBD3200562.1 hypothetical protein [Candidatus Lokiarchaeota archaeon]